MLLYYTILSYTITIISHTIWFVGSSCFGGLLGPPVPCLGSRHSQLAGVLFVAVLIIGALLCRVFSHPGVDRI